ncbi:hypothetical protein Tco_1016431 [Tanacetum coccineum]|uniref:Reverse transcriptase domain-containing protein n=1 Tax=Tanacetum coccineum TaxID=301880 RepID=A0ABQ5FNQ9_9ASTR
MNTASTSGSGTLPGNTVTNPKEDLKVSVNPHKLPKKLGDPGTIFLIPCEITGDTTSTIGVVLGASINLMPYFVCNNLSLPELTPTCMTLELADRSITKPDRATPEEAIHIQSGTKLSRYNSLLQPILSLNENHAIDMACDEYLKRFLGIFKRELSGNPTPYFEPIVSTASPNLTPFGDSDFLLFEEADSFLALEDNPTSSEVDPTYQDPEGDHPASKAILNMNHHHPHPPPPSQIKNNISWTKKDAKARLSGGSLLLQRIDIDTVVGFWGKSYNILKALPQWTYWVTLYGANYPARKNFVSDSIGPPTTAHDLLSPPFETFVQRQGKIPQRDECHKTPSKFANLGQNLSIEFYGAIPVFKSEQVTYRGIPGLCKTLVAAVSTRVSHPQLHFGIHCKIAKLAIPQLPKLDSTARMASKENQERLKARIA